MIDELETIWNEAVMVLSGYCTGIYLKGLRARSSGKNQSPTFLDTTRTALKTTFPTILLLRLYSLPR
jgi:hypothetical protein